MAAVDFRAGSTAIGGMGKGGGSGGGKRPQQSRPGRSHEESEEDYDSEEWGGFSLDEEEEQPKTRYFARPRMPATADSMSMDVSDPPIFCSPLTVPFVA
jgi:hypothetical protein